MFSAVDDSSVHTRSQWGHCHWQWAVSEGAAMQGQSSLEARARVQRLGQARVMHAHGPGQAAAARPAAAAQWP